MKKINTCMLLILSAGTLSFAERAVFSDDFGSGSKATNRNNAKVAHGWVVAGPELKEYNIEASGVLVIKDDLNNEKGTGVNQGSFDVASCDFSELCLDEEGDWIQVSADLQLFAGSYDGAEIARLNDGMRVSLTGNSSNNQGYGLYLPSDEKGGAIWVQFNDPESAGKKLQMLSGFNLRNCSSPVAVVIRIAKGSGGIELSGTFGEIPMKAYIVRTAVRKTFFDKVTFCLARADHGLKIDNVSITANK